MEIHQPSSEEVTSINGLTGSVILAAGTNITLPITGNTITINSTGGGSGTVTSVATDSTLTGGTITTTGTLGINLANANTWTAKQTIQLATNQLSLNFDGTHISTFTTNSIGDLTIAPNSGTGQFIVTGALMVGFSNSNLYIPASSGAPNTTSANYQWAGSTNNALRVGFFGNGSGSPVANGNYSSHIIGSSGVTLPSTGTTPNIANVVIKAIGTVTNGSSIPLTNSYSLYIDGASSAATNNYALYAASGNSFLGGTLALNISNSTTGTGTIIGGKYTKFGLGTPNNTVGASSTASAVELWDSDNTNVGVQYNVGNSSSGNNAYTGYSLNNDLASDGLVDHYAFIGLNSSTYNNTTFGTGTALANQLFIEATDGPISIVSTNATPQFINFLIGGAATTNEKARFTTLGLGVGTTTPNARLVLAGSLSTTTWTTSGVQLSIPAATLTDTSATGSPSIIAMSGIAQSTFASTNVITPGSITTLYIAGAPIVGTNVTPNNTFSLYIANGQVLMGGGFQMGTAAFSNNAFFQGTNTVATTTTSSVLFGGGATTRLRVMLGGSTNGTTLATGDNYVGTIVGSTPIIKFSSGTHAWLANMVVNPIGAVTGVATATNSASLYVNGALGSGATNNYAVYVTGATRIDLGSDATGDTLYRASANAGGLARIAIGSTGQIYSVSGGIPSWQSASALSPNGVVASADLTGQTTAVASVAAFTTAADGTYRVGGYLVITAVVTDVINFQVTWTDETNTSRTQTFAVMGTTTPNLSSTGFYPFNEAEIRVKASTTITVATVLTTGIGSITYDVGATIQKLR